MIKYSIRGENIEVTDAIRNYVESKLKKIEKKTVRCVWIRLDESKDADGFERVAQEELPFK